MWNCLAGTDGSSKRRVTMLQHASPTVLSKHAASLVCWAANSIWTCCHRSSTHALQALHPGATSNDLAKIIVIPEHGSTEPETAPSRLPSGPQSADGQTSRGPSFPFRHTRRKRAAESILSSIRRRYATFVDIASYAGLGLVFYAGKVRLLFNSNGWALQVSGTAHTAHAPYMSYQ